MCVPNVTTCVPCKWCTPSCALVALHVCTVCPQGHRPGHGTPGWGRLPLHWAELRLPSQPKPYRPVISQVAGDAFSRGLRRPPRCDFRLLRVGRRKRSDFPSMLLISDSSSGLGRRAEASMQGRDLHPQRSGRSRGEGHASYCPEMTEPSPKRETAAGPQTYKDGQKVTTATPLLLVIP